MMRALSKYTGVSVSELFGYRDPPFSDSLSKQILSELFDPRGLDNRTQKYTLWRSSHSFLSNSLILINWPFFLDIKTSRYLVGLLMIR